jgi:hypothetical protein
MWSLDSVDLQANQQNLKSSAICTKQNFCDAIGLIELTVAAV